MFQAMTPQNAVRCVTRYAPVVKQGSDPFSGWIKPLETVRNKLRTSRHFAESLPGTLLSDLQ